MLVFQLNIARPFEMVKDINDTKELWKIVVRIHHKWTVISKTKESLKMIVVDKDVSFLQQSSYLSLNIELIFVAF